MGMDNSIELAVSSLFNAISVYLMQFQLSAYVTPYMGNKIIFNHVFIDFRVYYFSELITA